MTPHNHSTSISPRVERCLKALLKGPVSRNELDLICHTSNSPDIVARVRELDIPVDCQRLPCTTFDGKSGYYGVYSLTPADKPKARTLLARVQP